MRSPAGVIFVSVFGSVLALAACGSGDEIGEGDPCGPNGTCPSGLQCNPVNNRCIKSGGAVDARPSDAAGPAFDAALPDAAVPDAALAFDARPAVDAAVPDAAPDAAATFDAAAGPTAVILSGAENGTSQSTVTFTYTTMPAVAGATFTCGLDGALTACDVAGQTFISLVDGTSHTFQVRATANGVAGPLAMRSFVVDTKMPVVTIVSPAADSVQPGDFILSFTVGETASTVQCSLNGAPLTPCTTGRSVMLMDGPYMLDIVAVDPAGNMGSASVKFTVDSSGPTASVTFPQPSIGNITGASGSIDIDTEAGTDHVDCTLDGAPVDCGSTFNFFFAATGEHTFTAQAFDANGTEGAIASVTWTADVDGPTTTISGAEDGVGGLFVNLIAFDELSEATTLYCRIDNDGYQVCGFGGMGSMSWTRLTSGDHTVWAYAEDVWGNTGPESVQTFTIHRND